MKERGIVRLKWPVHVAAGYTLPWWNYQSIGWFPGLIDASVVAAHLKQAKKNGWRIVVGRAA